MAKISALSNTEGPKLQIKTGEIVSLRINHDIFHANGLLKDNIRFSACDDSQLFTLSWPNHAAKKLSTLSHWRLAINKGCDDRIASFYQETVEKIGFNNWEVIKTLAGHCRHLFQAQLLSASITEFVFAHESQESSVKMKNSNEMIDIMNGLLAETEYSFCDILVDWEVTTTSIAEEFSYKSVVGDGEIETVDSCSLITDDVSYPYKKSGMSKSSTTEELPPPFRQIMKMIAAESKKTQEAITQMEEENAARYRTLCQMIEELKDAVEHNNESMEMPVNKSEQSLLGFNQQSRADTTQYQHHCSPQPAQASSWSHHTEESSSCVRILKKEDSARLVTSFEEEHCCSDLENRNLRAAVDLAIESGSIYVPRAKSYSTILCLDISESMKQHGAFEEMKEFVSQFIDGVEDIVNDIGVEENIGVVTFGGTAKVAQNLTNDFSRVRDVTDNMVPGGRSPFIQALLVSIAAISGKGGVSVSRMYEIFPRIIFISDGFATENIEDGGIDQAYNKQHVTLSLTSLMMRFSRKEKYKRVHPVVFVPVGQKADIELMKSMARISQGEYLEPEHVHKLCGFFMVQETIRKTLACMKSSNIEYAEEQISDVAKGVMPSLTEEQQAEVVRVVRRELETPSAKRYWDRTSDFNDTFENTVKVDAGEMLPLGTRVVRGPDWHWKDQDGHGPGTVLSHADKEGHTWVLWDAGRKNFNRYPYGPDLGYAIWKTDQHPRLIGSDQEMHIGMVVQKGPNLSFSEDTKGVHTGVVIRKSGSKRKLMVRWDNGVQQVVRYGSDNMYDVMYCDPTQLPQESPFECVDATIAPTPKHLSNSGEITAQSSENKADSRTTIPVIEHGKWQFLNENGQWEDYPAELNVTIEKAFKKKPDSSCVVVKYGRNYRIMFRRMTEKDTGSGTECSVRRIPA